MLGGIHLLISFLSVLCNLVQDNGLKKWFSTVYKENFFPKTLGEKAYSREQNQIFERLIIMKMLWILSIMEIYSTVFG